MHPRVWARVTVNLMTGVNGVRTALLSKLTDGKIKKYIQDIHCQISVAKSVNTDYAKGSVGRWAVQVSNYMNNRANAVIQVLKPFQNFGIEGAAYPQNEQLITCGI